MCKNGIYLQKYGFLFNAFSCVSKNVKKRGGFAYLFQNGLQSDKYFVNLHRKLRKHTKGYNITTEKSIITTDL